MSCYVMPFECPHSFLSIFLLGYGHNLIKFVNSVLLLYMVMVLHLMNVAEVYSLSYLLDIINENKM